MKTTTRAAIARKFYNILESAVVPILHTRKPSTIFIKKNIRYGRAKRDRCDFISLKEDSQTKRPIFIFIHGGGYVSGFKHVRQYYCYEYAKKGFFVVNIDYEYAPMAKHPEQIRQIYNLLDILYERADELNIDITRIIVGGDSAGGYFAAMVAAAKCCSNCRNIFAIDSRHFEEVGIIGCLLLCGAYNISRLAAARMVGMTTFVEAYSGLSISDVRNSASDIDLDNIIDGHFPPSFIIKADNDPLKFESDYLERKLTRLGVPFASYLATGLISQHCFPLVIRSRQGKECLKAALDYLGKVADGMYADRVVIPNEMITEEGDIILPIEEI